MVVTARGDKSRFSAIALGQFETQHAAVEEKRALQIGNSKMHMTDGDVWIYRPIIHYNFSLPKMDNTAVEYN